MSGCWLGLFMIMTAITAHTPLPPPALQMTSEAILPAAPPPPYRLLPAARFGRMVGVTLPAPRFDRTPFAERVELPLVQMWGGRLSVNGFHSDVSYMGPALDDPQFRRLRVNPGVAVIPRSSSYGVRIAIWFNTNTKRAVVSPQPR